MDPIRIGAFELHPSERMLMAAGKPVELGARAFDLLLVLVENHGRLVTKATLLDRVWPRLVVDENNLPAQIACLRRIFGAGAIRTVPGFGYRLELAVAPRDTAPAPAVIAESTQARDCPRFAIPRRGWPDRLPRLIGRDDDVEAVQASLDHACLVTVVGGAGVGKTRLAQEILVRENANEHAVAWVSLESIDSAAHVASAIALALGLSLPEGLDEFAALRQALEEFSLLLILDGAEHLADTLATPLDKLVSQTRGVKLLVTSQAPLRVAGEIVYRLTALPVPETDIPEVEAASFPAVTLFAQRAAAADRRFELNTGNTPQVAAICRHLDGNPLALELAAARIPALGVAGLLDHLGDRFRLLRLAGRAHDPRHGALHAAFEWSYSLLTPAEQRVFTRLGAFAGSFSLQAASRCVADEEIDAAEAIDLISRLVDRSLVTALQQDAPRFVLLETARCFARERLVAANELEAARGRMAAAMLQVLDEAYQEYWSLDEGLWLQRYGGDLENVRAAIDWATDNDRALGVALYGAAWPLFMETELFAEARARYEQTVRLITDALPRARLGRFWEAVATYDSTRQWDRARYAAELAASMYADTGDVRSRYYTLMLLALNWRDDNAAARNVFVAATKLEHPSWPPRLLTQGALTEGALLLSAGNFAEARAAYQRAVRLALTVSERQGLAATVSVVELDLACGDVVAALQLGRPLSMSLRHSGRRATRVELLAVIFRALLLAEEKDEARATGAELFESALRLDPGKLYTALDAMAFLACSDQRYEAAARIACCADVSYQAHGQARRRPTDERIRCCVTEMLEAQLGCDWATAAAGRLTDEAAACSLALGLDA
ncbi:MAG TPA: winged helix-turn-helix domain-containing protein [Povalibacter sp.]|nr:winged helix-turn-helix domain-containing protein [Povalibacter sp.]